MHAAAYRALGLPHVYEAVRVEAEGLPAIVAALRAGAYGGLNVTVPHKQRVMALVDRLDDSARDVGAANTLVRTEGGEVVAYNTDAPALAAEIARVAGMVGARAGRDGPWVGGRGLVIGSGGAARAAVVAMRRLGLGEIAVRARAFEDPARREAFVRQAPAPVLAEPLTAPAGSRGEADARTVAVVQATSAGMKGADPGAPIAEAVHWSALPDQAVAIDVVYAPRDTPFLAAARARGLRCDDGLGMLARQGALALEHWLGVSAPFEVMRAALE